MNLYAKLVYVISLSIIFKPNTAALYSNHKNVISLTTDNFDELVLKSDEVWIVEFYAPWCVYCQNFAREYIKAADVLRGIVKVGAIDADVHKELPGRYGIRGLPTIKIFGPNKIEPEDYNEARTAKRLIEAGINAAKAQILKRLGVEDRDDFMESSNVETSDVVELTDNNFDELVLQSDDVWMVEFYAHWCGHCKALEPHWASAAKILKGKVNFGKLDGSANKNKATQYDVTAYPAVKLFRTDKTETPIDYNGGRRKNDIVEWLEQKLVDVSPPEVSEILDESSLRGSCEDKEICILTFLPSILDCNSKCRNGHIRLLKTMANMFKKYDWGWVWSEADDQPDLENVLTVDKSNFPTMVAANYEQGIYAILRKSFTDDGVYEFLNNLANGKNLNYLKQGDGDFQIYTVRPWDGTDEVYLEDHLYDKDEL